MSTDPPRPRHTLDAVLRPRSVAVIGASNSPTRIGGRPIRYLLEAGFQGPIYPVNPKHQRVQGLAAVGAIDEVTDPIDLAIVAVPAPDVVRIVETCAARGVRAVLIFSAGFAETGTDGRDAQRRLSEIAASTGMRIVGPNCLGVYNSSIGFFGTFTTTLEDGFPVDGGVGLVSQSGAYGSHLSLLAKQRRIGVRYWITTGNEADVTVPESIEWLADQADVSVIVAYAEGITDPATLIRALDRARAAHKPIVFMKVGASAVGAAAARSHTASLAGDDAVYDAAFRQYGAYRARSTEDMLDVAYAAGFGVFPPSRRVALLSISGGVGVQMADAAVAAGLDVAPMSDDAQARLKAALPYASPRNPVDITAQAFNNVDLIADNLDLILADGRYDSIVAFFTYVAAANGMVGPIRDTLRSAKARHPHTVIVLSIVGPPEVVRQYEAVGCPVFEDPTRAVHAVAALHRFAALFDRTPSEAPCVAAAETPLPTGPIGEHAAKRILAAAGLPIADERLARTADEAVQAADALGYPVAVKLASADVVHKTELGAVVLDVASAAAVHEAFETVTARARSAHPSGPVDGALVSRMVTGGVETILGVQRDPTFGPVVMFGLGGVFVETLNDVSFRVAPFDETEARRMIAETKGSAILDGARTGRPFDVAALAAALARLSAFAAGHGDELESAEVNPFVVLPEGQGAVALDAVLLPRRV